MDRVHELSLCHAIANVVRPYVEGRRVDVVRVQVGALRQVVPESLEYCWSVVRTQEGMPDAELHLDWVPAEVHCRGCRRHSTIESRWSVRCPSCDTGEVDLICGDEFAVMSVDVSDVPDVGELD